MLITGFCEIAAMVVR